MTEGPCPFDSRLWRTPYLVIPKLAIQAMPMEWRHRFEALMAEAALARANEMKAAKIASLKRQIERLESLEF